MIPSDVLLVILLVWSFFLGYNANTIIGIEKEKRDRDRNGGNT